MTPECCGGPLSPWPGENWIHATWCSGYLAEVELALEKAEDALARVRALCAAAEERPYGHQLLCPAEIRAAVEGDNS